MHHLFELVLGHRDLSRAGDLFSLEDFEIEDSLSEALQQIKIISSSEDYQINDNDQAVVEICITRITTAIRETETIEKHSEALVSLWESCLEHNLTSGLKDEDTPHAKIASDIMSCILQNYNRPTVMLLAIPVAVKFLWRGNKELCRNMSSYISLAAIAKADLLADHTEAIVNSVLQGNSMLLRVLPALYELQPQPINCCLRDLVSQMPQLDEGEQHHMLRLLQTVAKGKQPKVLTETIPFLMNYLSDPSYSDIILNLFIDISAYEPHALAKSLSTLKDTGEHFPGLIGQIAKIYGAVGHLDEDTAKICLTYLASQLTNMEHSFHHILLMEIKNIVGTFKSILETPNRDMYRMSNSFNAMAKLLNHHLANQTTPSCRKECNIQSESPFYVHEDHEVSFQKEEEKESQVKLEDISDQKQQYVTETDIDCIQRGLKNSKEDKKELIFSRSKNLALSSVSKCLDSSQDIDNSEVIGLISFSHMFLNQEDERCKSDTETGKPPVDKTLALGPINNWTGTTNASEPSTANQSSRKLVTENQNQHDMLCLQLKENLDELKKYIKEMGKKIPVPDQCVLEDTVKGCVAKLFFSCPMKGHYCLYSKSSFTLISQQPQLWIHILFLFHQSLLPEPLAMHSATMQVLQTLWEKMQPKNTHSFKSSLMQSMFPHKKDLDLVQTNLEEERFFDLFGFSEEVGSWLCFMCNNPEKATVVNQDGQPLIEGKLKEKQVRWKFIKRWKTRYFTLAGNQLLFRKGKSDDPDDCPIELSKVQSVKAVVKKRRDRSLPRAFEIFTDNKTYVFKAKDEKKAEEWLQCINVAVAQAKERESREATTYL
ncbi:ventricular zone-expressed PH domain-containing protein homolog 1 isoform X2 [Xenopus tropicalis]|uniref:Ventricular zone-expressed PH domain-containing protein homolog 1 isoform X2 n=1 Tax=Xenopus tropicalis TaxID=8364 RepID=A0A8J1JK62_XENTR|nr:ventricular zone-expressed PH domain-containing protein homolog 1 isoform X2 [Xenopus tropicalis]